LPPWLRPWLLSRDSLTQRLREACVGPLQVRVRLQTWVRPLAEESRLLHLPSRRYAQVRQVHLCCNTQPWVFARTLIPLATLTGARRRLLRLGTKPLGEVLFADPQLRRGPLEIARLQPGQPLYNLATAELPQPPAVLWGRRSLFYLQDKPLLVSEFFLPALSDCDG